MTLTLEKVQAAANEILAVCEKYGITVQADDEDVDISILDAKNTVAECGDNEVSERRCGGAVEFVVRGFGIATGRDS